LNLILLILSLLAGLAGLGCWIYLVVAAFQDEIWKGFVSFLCCFYLGYWAIFDFDHDYKWPIIIGAFGGSTIAGGIAGLMR
jgi:hypothetical protein